MPTMLTMASARPLIECIFCGTTEPQGRRGEDIISDWYARAFHGPGDYTVEMVEITPTEIIPNPQRRVQTVANLRLPDVCQHCNNTWMADLEKVAGVILTQMMQGDAKVLDGRERRIVAVWCQLKAVTLDARYPTRQLPEAVAQAMHRRLPLRSLGVQIGKFDPEARHHVYFSRRSGTTRVQTYAEGERARSSPGQRSNQDIFRVTFAFSHFAFQVTTAVNRDLPVEFLVFRGNPFWVSVWPPELRRNDQPVSWPPVQIIPGIDGLRVFL